MEIAPALLPFSTMAQFAGGKGTSDGSPMFTGSHPLTYFTVDDPVIRVPAVPEPAALLMGLLGLLPLGLAGRRRRRR
ncbi:MAG: PEP-CTERM sorting domain-containing protein [Planctomycetales bacterium]|nr:PEP-CTERM sorting domain-containing protein [Planctomycetales bacterium]NIP68483.1 PEP-CTERM sorting domain-containing protein [Planctomycetales bacterium]